VEREREMRERQKHRQRQKQRSTEKQRDMQSVRETAHLELHRKAVVLQQLHSAHVQDTFHHAPHFLLLLTVQPRPVA
jgi:hypothetical protein